MACPRYGSANSLPYLLIVNKTKQRKENNNKRNLVNSLNTYPVVAATYPATAGLAWAAAAAAAYERAAAAVYAALAAYEAYL